MPSIQPRLTLFLVRHGQTTPDHEGMYDDDAELSDVGRQQAKAVAKALDATHIEALYTSPVRRAAQTADVIAERLSLEPVLDARLVEIELSRQVVHHMRAGGIFPLWQGHHRSHENGETLADFATRVGAVFRDVAEWHEGQAVAVVSHGGVINQLLRRTLGFDADHEWQFHFELLNGSITEVVFWPRGAARDHAPWYTGIKRVGDTAHLTAFASHV
jgi:probable phosphoglycerate mutase